MRNTKEEDGHLVWHRRTGQFEPSVVAMRGEALAELSVMTRSPAKTLAETNTLLAEFQAKRKAVKDITEVPLDGAHVLTTRLGNSQADV